MPFEHCDLNKIGIDNGYAIAYFYDCVLIGTVANSEYKFCKQPEWDKLMELHVFDDQREYRAVYSNEMGWRKRMLRDDENEMPYVEETIRIIGNREGGKKAGADGFFQATEAGRCVMLPETIRGKGIVVRSYMKFEPISGEANEINERCYLSDYRFAGFADWKEARVDEKRKSV